MGEILNATNLPKTTVYGHIYDIPLSAKTKRKIKKEATTRLNNYIKKERKGKCLPGRNFLKPSQWSHELIFIISHFLFDGRIKHEGCEYYNRSDYLIEAVRTAVKNLLGLDSKIYKRKFGVKQIRYYNVELGIYAEEKAKELFKYIKTASLQEKKVFLRSFFDDEGSVYIYKNIRLVRGFQHNLLILKLIEKLLKDFNIESRIDEKYKEIIIGRKENLIRFREKINFSEGICINHHRKNSVWKQSLEKREILDKAINSYL